MVTAQLNDGLLDHGGLPLLPVALRHVRHMESALTGTDRALQTAASGLATWAAWVAKDAGRFDVAEHVGRLALNMAERAGDQEAQSAACSVLSRVSISSRRLDRAVMYAKRGIDLPEITPAQRGWLYMRLGRALALIGGQEYAARDALAHAQGAADHLSTVVDVADLAGNIGEGLIDLRAYGDAHASLDESASLTEGR